MLPVHKGLFDSLQQNAMRWNNRLRQGMAVCNGLALINKTVVGEDLERNMFKAVEARFLVRPIPEHLRVCPRALQHGNGNLDMLFSNESCGCFWSYCHGNVHY